ncbi:MAG: hypothetical protein ACI8WB_001817, partial [Phenylobacterium sp.]
TALFSYSNSYICLYAPIFRAKMPCSEAKSKHAEQLQTNKEGSTD